MSQPSAAPEARPAKRQRVDDEEEGLTRSDIWHDDGSVVLRVERTLFRVHWTVLCLHSSVFRDLRGIPQPPEEPQIEGCPVVELHDDTQDITLFLTALYNPHRLSEEIMTLDFIGAIVRIGRKYDVQNLLKPVVQRLAREHPTTFENYEATTQVHRHTISWTSNQVSHYEGLIFDIVTLARANNLLTLLPCAYLRVVLFCDLAWILDGVTKDDGSKVTLSFQDQRACILGRQKLQQAQWEHEPFASWIRSSTPAAGCKRPEFCTRRLGVIYEAVVHNGMMLPPFLLVGYNILCTVCQPHHLRIMKDAREKMWQNLPTFFDLPPWADLKDGL
ncbi:BTB domain-containing protein [Favolaschia claudopus]|uniref:BTB domain-containing protein n=1 Tax=Favolaschia claudopus TaxID=2862362 RepID=A0AAW0DMJ5_9AGAR